MVDDFEVVQAGVWYLEMWRGLVVLAATFLMGGLIRLYMERSGRLPRRIERERSSSGLVLLMLAGSLYIILDVIRNFGNEDLNWYETPLASVIVVGSGLFIGNLFRKGGRRGS